MNRLRMWWKQTRIYAWYRLHFRGQRVATVSISRRPRAVYRGMTLDVGGKVEVELLEISDTHMVIGELGKENAR